MNLHKPDRCPTCKRRYRRSHPQNARYWSLLHVMAERIKPLGAVYSAEQWHLWAKSKYLGADDIKLPSGKVLMIPRSTADLDVDAFNDYMTKVEAFANERNCFLEDDAFAA